MWKQWIYNKLQTTDYTQEQEGQIRQKTFFKKSLRRSERHRKDKQNQDKWWMMGRENRYEWLPVEAGH